MDKTPTSQIYKFFVETLTDQKRADQLTTLLKQFPEVERTDINLEKRLIRVITSTEMTTKKLQSALSSHGFHLRSMPSPTSSESPDTAPRNSNLLRVGISGLTCRSCEITIERTWKKLPGVKKVDVNCATGQALISVENTTLSIDQLQQALGDNKYTVRQNTEKQNAISTAKHQRPSFLRLVGLFALVLLLGKIFSDLGLLKTNFSIGAGLSFGAIFLVGLVAASSSCIAVVGGLLLSSAAKFNERYASAGPLARMRPVLLFVAGRTASYTLLGGLLGVIGGVLTPSPLVTAFITILAAVYMIVMGLDMLYIAPAWLKRVIPRMPKKLSHRIMDAEGKEHPVTPFALGAATFFLPCGFTQALQLYALTTGNFVTSALMLLAFALGTAPALLALGYASSSLKGKIGQFFFRFSGALVVVLGLWNIQNGFTIAGYPLRLPSFQVTSATQAVGNTRQVDETNVAIVGNTQIAKMTLGYRGYEANNFTIKAGIPVRWEVDGTNASGCTSVLTSRQLGIQKLLEPGTNVFEFTPQEPGKIAFNCSMGMVRGSFTVVPST